MKRKHFENESCSACNIGRVRKENQKIVFIGLSAILLVIGLVFEFNLRWELPANIIFITVAIISGYSIAREGLDAT